MLPPAKKRPLTWRLDDALGMTPLFDVITGGPRYGGGIRDWLTGIYIVVRALASPRGRAYSRWQRAYDRGSPSKDRLYQELLAIEMRGRMPSYSDDENE